MENKKKYELVLKAYHNAYAKYSNFSVGALVITKDDNYYLVANIENASYGLVIVLSVVPFFQLIQMA